MVPHEVEPAEGVRGAVHDVAGEIVGAQVAGQRQGAATGGGDLLHHRLDPSLVDVGDPDRRALARKAQRAGPPHARGGGSDDPDLPVHAHHSLPPDMRLWNAEFIP